MSNNIYSMDELRRLIRPVAEAAQAACGESEDEKPEL